MPDMPEFSKYNPTIGRIVHLHCPSMYGIDQPRAAIVVRTFGGPTCNVRVFDDPYNDTPVPCTSIPGSIHVYDQLTRDERVAMDVGGIHFWCEWPPRT